MCGVAGAIGVPNAAEIVMTLMYANQHRGEGGAGIVGYNNETRQMISARRLGLVSHLQEKIQRHQFDGVTSMIGHNRYSTFGSESLANVQPLVSRVYGPGSEVNNLAVCHNGDLVWCDFEGEAVSIEDLRVRLYSCGVSNEATSDTALLFPLIARAGTDDMIENIFRVVNGLQGAFNLLFLWKGHLIVVKDPWDFRPLSIGRYNGGYVFSSERCIFDKLGIEYVRDVRRGEVMVITPELKVTSRFVDRTQTVSPAHCSFCFVYLARPDSILWGQSVSHVRRLLGIEAATEALGVGGLPLDGKVIPIMDSGRTSALGVFEVLMREILLDDFKKCQLTEQSIRELQFPQGYGMNRNHYFGRIFITAGTDARNGRVSLKHNVDSHEVSGWRIIEVDDSIVRGTTTANHVKLLRQGGARSVHVIIPSPRVSHTCHFGIDMKNRGDLLCANTTLEQEREKVGADTLVHLSDEGFEKCLGCPGEFCTACFTGKYPIQVPNS